MSKNKLIDERVERADVRLIDFHGRRITNASPSQADYDYVVRKELEVLIPPTSKKAGATLETGGSITYTSALNFYARFGLETLVLTGNAKHLHVVVLYVDETKIDKLNGTLGADINNSTDPIIVAVTITALTGFAFAVNDYVIFDDSAQDSGNTDFRSYEIAKITNISGSNFTFSRAQFGSFKSAHLAGIKFYLLKLGYFGYPADKTSFGTNAFPKQVYFDLASACIVATAAAVSDSGGLGPWSIKNWSRDFYPFPGSPSQLNPAPGARTLNGAEYLLPLSGALTVGQSLGTRAWVGEDASVRNIVVNISAAPTGNNTLYNGVLANFTNIANVIYVLYIESGLGTARKVGIVDQLAIRENEFFSFNDINNMPAYRRMPYLPKWPTVRFPVIGVVSSLYDSNTGLLQDGVLPFVAQNDYIYFKEGGELDAVVALIGTSFAGINATVSVMT